VLALEHRVEAVRKLPIAVANQKPNRFCALGETPGNLPRLLRHPLGVRVRRATSQVHAAAADFDEEEHVQSLKLHGVDREEIHGDHALRLCRQELTPRNATALARWAELFLTQDLLDGSCRHNDSRVAGVTRNNDQWRRGNRRLAAVKNNRSAARNVGRRT
jgi:hypothetical protein